MCKDSSLLWLIHDHDFHCFMKNSFLQGCRLDKLPPHQAAVFLQQFIPKENCTGELLTLLTVVWFAPQGVCRDSPHAFQGWEKRCSWAAFWHHWIEAHNINEESKSQDQIQEIIETQVLNDYK